ncbi:MAG: diadenylate cyclase CdaA [Phycisphaerae bacterium]|jgi:diadenylate cyclase|nr:diadenylate cyclase CdaA [Phycisphaerae bacterium]MDP7637177.1 diadenylate cyclase CdaA [Phycisphaerae bacterium]
MKVILDAINTYLHRIAGYNPLVIAVELFLIGVVVWWVMRFLRGTRGARLVKGVAVILATVYIVINLLPEEMEWHRVKFLYGHFLIFAFVAVVVAFQPEIRRVLLQVGQARFLHTSRSEVQAMIDALTESTAYLSRNKIGAVIAIERSVGLGAIVQAGTPIDGELTSGLLNTIFYPGSTLHDMGVIVRGRRVVAAGCQFPMAESDEVDASLGSRHRAALGLSKDSDAVVVVVSEETGRVSVACEGQLYLGLEAKALKDMLEGLMAPRKMARRRRKAARHAQGDDI